MFIALSPVLIWLQTFLFFFPGNSLESQLGSYLKLEHLFFFPYNWLIKYSSSQLIPEHWYGENKELGLKTPFSQNLCAPSPPQEWKDTYEVAKYHKRYARFMVQVI